MRPKYEIEIDVSDHECDRYDRWANYGTITACGNNLEELLEDAQVDIIDQDGGELNVVAADSNWMQDLIEEAFNEKYLKAKV